MSVLRAGLRPAFAWFVIAHGLAHAVLPMRGRMDPAGLAHDFSPFLLYSVAVIGFAVAGLGLLRVRPFTGMVRPALVLASAYSLVTISIIGTGEFRWGAAVDATLLAIALSGVYQRLPSGVASQTGYWSVIKTAATICAVIYATAAVWLWPLHRSWGTAPPEFAMALPGDAANRNAALELQHAVTIDAPPAVVWAWLVQLGQDRGGFYSYDWLERAFGVDIHNVTEIRGEWQARQAGDRVAATQANYLGGVFGREPGWRVREIQPNRAMVLEQWGAFVLAPTADGRTRFIIRTTVGGLHLPAWAAVLDVMAFEVPHFIMERRMMLTIKSLAERQARAPRTMLAG